jgi:hypothetical protein
VNNDANANKTIALLEVQARWAYGEVTDGTLSHTYDGLPWIGALRQKRTDGVEFSNLPEEDRYALALACAFVRPNLMIFFTGVEQFREVSLNRAALGNVLVPPMVSPDLNGQFLNFDAFVALPPPADPGDARNVDGNPANYQAPSDPLTIGRYFNRLVLVDGFHRAVRFWRAAPGNATIRCFVPF